MNKNIVRLLRECRKRSGYGYGHTWEPSMNYDEANPNHPFQGDEKVSGLWGGDLGDWKEVIESARIGHRIDCYVTKTGDELVTNYYITVTSETTAYVQDCGGKPKVIEIQ